MTGTDPTYSADRQPLTGPCVRVFELVRHKDVTGYSGVGVVADGVEFPDASVAFRWCGPNPSTVMFGSIDAVIAVHGHGGATEVRWVAIIPDYRRHRGKPDTETSPVDPADPTDGPRRSGWSGTAWDRHDDPHWPPPFAP